MKIISLAPEVLCHGHELGRRHSKRTTTSLVITRHATAASAAACCSVLPAKNRVIVEGVNIIKRHTQAEPAANIKGGIVEREAALHASNVQLVCPECGKPTRVGHKMLDDGRKVRICRKCKGVVDK